MNKMLKSTLALLILLFLIQNQAFSQGVGQISGKLILDDSWERKIYVSHIKTLEKEYAVSNNLIIKSAVIDSLGNFKIDLDKVPNHWSFLRLHIVKKGLSPNSLIIGSTDENFMFLIAKRDSKLKLFNDHSLPIFSSTKVIGGDYMKTLDYIKKLSYYPNSIDYENSIIEKEFIMEVVCEKLKTLADTCSNPLVSLYAIYQTDFQRDNIAKPQFFQSYLSKWKNEDSPYFDSFRQKFSLTTPPVAKTKTLSPLIFLVIGMVLLAIVVLIYFKKKTGKIKQLSVQERKIFELIRNGMSNKEISSECNIELTTVKSHVGNIYSKLKIKSRKEAINLKVK